MRAKPGVAIAGIALAIFIMGRVENLSAGRGFSGSIAWAQDADDSAADAASQDDATAQDNSAAQDDADSTAAKTIVSAGGVYSGTVMDNDKGAGTISAAVSQIHAKLIGTWQDTFVPPAFIVGTITAKGKITMRMRFHLTGNCGYVFTGAFVNGDEISGSYVLKGCKGMAPDHGTLQMTKQ